jgi:beta-glucosidase
MPENLLRDIYLCPFKAAVDAGVATLMTAFNEINGVPATGNRRILRDILRDEWAFAGIVVSDWRATAELINHGFCEDLKDAARKSLLAGVDMEMQSSAYAEYLEQLVTEDDKFLQLIDAAATHILKIKFQLGLFENRDLYCAKLPGRPRRQDLDLAKTAALKSIVLLKNKNAVLPLSRKTRSIAVLGPLAHDPYEILGTWNRDGCTEDTVTPLTAIEAFLGESTEIRYVAALDYSRSVDTSQFSLALEYARKSDAVLFFAGEEAILSGEAHSRAHLHLPGSQEALISEIAKSGKPIVLIILAGRPLIIGEIAEQVDAVLYGWHPGTMCGPALADLIFGIESPSGKLPITFPKTEGQIPVYYAHKNTGRPPEDIKLTMIDDIPLRAYQSSLGDAARYLDIGYLPLYPFGYGLSYSEFAYANIKVSSEKMHLRDTFSVSAEVTNTGTIEADEVVQLYIRDLVGSLTRPVRELKGFERIRLKPKETRTVVFNLSTDDLGFHACDMKYVVEPGKFRCWIGGSSQADLMAEFQIFR